MEAMRWVCEEVPCSCVGGGAGGSCRKPSVYHREKGEGRCGGCSTQRLAGTGQKHP